MKWGTNFRGVRLALAVLAVGPSGALATNTSAEVTVAGPVETLDCVSRTVQVLGIQLQSTDSAQLKTLCWLQGSGNAIYVVAHAQLMSGESALITKLTIGRDMYVPGVSLVYVRGKVSAANEMSGEFSVSGGKAILFAAEVPSLGALVEVVGTQPQLGGAVLANALAVADTNGIVGSGRSTTGIVGSGVITTGIVGSGNATNGIVGSGKSTTGIVGSGVVEANGIVGSGFSSNGIVGSGKSTTGIVGSGVATSGIVGSGIATNGIVGSGKSTSGIVGSGVTTNGIVGSGVATNGIVGSGATSN